jgi:type I restriction enzyme S subunit
MKSTLAQECSIAIGGTPARNRADYWDLDKQTSNHWVAISDLHRRYISSTAERISHEGVRNSSAKLVARGSVLLSFKLTLGRTAIAGVDLYTNEAIAALRSESLDHLFLHYGLQSWDLLGDLDQAIKGGTLNKAKLKRIPISFPQERQVQERIASVMDAIDRAIEQAAALLAKQQLIKTGVMHDLLTCGIDAQGRIRPPGALPVPPTWTPKTLGQLAVFNGGYAFKRHELREFGHTVVRISNLHKPDFPYWHYDGPVREEWIVRAGDLLFSWAGVASSIDAYVYQGENALINQHIYNLVIPDDDLRLFTFHYLTWLLPKLRQEIEGGAGQLHLTKAKIQAIPIPCPQNGEMLRINGLVGALNNTERLGQSRLEKLRRLKSGLMTDLFTGRVPVSPLLPNSET